MKKTKQEKKGKTGRRTKKSQNKKSTEQVSGTDRTEARIGTSINSVAPQNKNSTNGVAPKQV